VISRTKEIGCLVLILLLASCSKEVSLPHSRSSIGLTMDGSHHVGVSGGPDIVGVSKPIDSNAVQGGWSTAPLPLSKPFSYAVGARNGRIVFFDEHDSLGRMLVLTDHSPIDQLLASGDTLYAIGISGLVNAFGPDGKILWQASVNAVPSAPSLLTSKSVVVTAGSEVHAFEIGNGKQEWMFKSPSSITSTAYSQKRDLIYLVLAAQDADTILVLGSNGIKKASLGLPGLRITSNIAINESETPSIVFGALGEAKDQRREAVILQYQGVETNSAKLVWKHPVQFLGGNISLNSHTAFASGFRTIESDVASGITAFSLTDTATLWHRVFTEPIVAPIAAGDANIYFTVSFESQAQISSRGIFETLSASDGTTVSERAARGAAGGFLSHMPMPDELGRFLVADRLRPVIHIFDRSGLKRMF